MIEVLMAMIEPIQMDRVRPRIQHYISVLWDSRGGSRFSTDQTASLIYPLNLSQGTHLWPAIACKCHNCNTSAYTG